MAGKKTKTLSGLFPSAKKRDHKVKTTLGGEITVHHMKGAIQSRVVVRERKEETGQLEDVAVSMGHKNIIAGTPARRRTSTSRAHMTSSYFSKNNVEEEDSRVPKKRRSKKSDLKITNLPIIGLKRKHPVAKGNNVLRQFDSTEILAKKFRHTYDSNIQRMYGRKKKASTSTAKTSRYFNKNSLEESTSRTRTSEPRISRPLTSHMLKKRERETSKELKDGPSSKLPKLAIQDVLNQFSCWNNSSIIVASAKKISRRALTQEERGKLSGTDSDSTISTEFSRACSVSPFPPPQRNKRGKKTTPKVILKFPLNILRQKVENTVNHRLRIPDYSQILKADAKALFRKDPMSREMFEILTNEINDVEHTKIPSQDLWHRKTLAHHSNHSSTLPSSQSHVTSNQSQVTSPHFTEETEIRPMVDFSSQPNTLTQAETRPSVIRSSSQCSNGNQIHPPKEFQSHHDYNLPYNSCLNIHQACTNVPLYRHYPLVRELPKILDSPDSAYFPSSQDHSYEHEDVVNVNQNQCRKAVVRNLFASPQNHPPLDTNINQQCCSQINNQNHNDNNVHSSHSHPVGSDVGGAISANMFKVPPSRWSGNFSTSAQLRKVFPGTSHTFYNSQEKHGSNKMDRMGNLDLLNNGETMIAEAVRTGLADANEEMVTNKWEESCLESCTKYFVTSVGEAQETEDWNAPVREKVAEMPVVNPDASEINLWRKKVNTSLGSGQFSKDGLSRTVVIGNVDCKFIAAKMPFRGAHDGSKETEVLVLFDQHAVHERILLERHIESAFEERVPGQKSIIYSRVTPPMRMNFTDTEVRIMESNKKNFRLLGIQLEIVDSHTVMFLTIPKCFAERVGREHGPNREKTGRRLMRSIVEDQARYIMNTSGAIQAMPIAILDVLKSQACRGAVKFGDSLSTEACVQLINDLKHCKVPFQCAHGRPAVAPISLDLKEVA